MIIILVSEAAKQLGMSTQTLRLALQQGLFPFGCAIKTSTNRYTYYERTLDTIQVDSNTYQVNAIYSGCKLMSVVRVCTFNK